MSETIRKALKQLSLASMFLAIGLVLPFFTGQIPQVGSMMLPMHIPVLLCGLICGWKYGLMVGFVLPVLRSFLFGMPVFFPMAVCMSVELACYGFLSGFLYQRLSQKRWSIYLSLISAMIVGRSLWGIARWFCVRMDTSAFGLSAFWSGAFVTAIPGIILQIVLIPLIVMLLDGKRKTE